MFDKINDYIIYKKLDTGGFGDVYQCYLKEKENKYYAIKLIKIDKDNSVNILSEINLLKILNSPYIPKLYEYFDFYKNNKKYIALVQEYIFGETLYDFIIKIKKNKVDIKLLIKLSYQMITGLKQIHDIGICHFDIKLTNIMINYNYDAVIIDLGLSCINNDLYNNINKCKNKQFVSGTPEYFSPELAQHALIFSDTNFNCKKSDIWALGIVLYILFYQKDYLNIPSNYTTEQKCIYIMNTYYKDNYKVSINKFPIIDNLLIKMLDINPLTRADINYCYKFIYNIYRNNK